MEKKLQTSVEMLCNDFPNEFVTFLQYSRSLRFEDRPDYSYLKRLFKDLYIRQGYEQNFDIEMCLNSKNKTEEEETKST